MVFSDLSLSDDIYRYLFNGHLIKNGLNPYQFSPDSVNMQVIMDSFPYYNLINNSSVSDPYPPLMLIFTFSITLITQNNLILWKIIISSFVIFVSLLIKKILEKQGKNANNIIFWSWNPLVILEFSHSGHNDIFSIFFLVSALYFLVRKQSEDKKYRFLSGFLWGISISLKVFPIIILLFFVKKLRIEGLIGVIFSLSLNLLIILAIGAYSITGFLTFIQNWIFNGGIFEIVSFGVQFISNIFLNILLPIGEIYSLIRIIFIILIVIFLIALLIIYSFKIRDPNLNTSLIYSSTMFYLLFILSPVLHPWYVLWALPIFIFVCNSPLKRSYFLFTITVMFSYYFYACSCNDIAIIVVEYLPIFILLLIDLFIFIKLTDKMARFNFH